MFQHPLCPPQLPKAYFLHGLLWGGNELIDLTCPSSTYLFTVLSKYWWHLSFFCRLEIVRCHASFTMCPPSPEASKVGTIDLCALAVAQDLQGTQQFPWYCMSWFRGAELRRSSEGFQLQAGLWTNFSTLFKKCFSSSRETIFFSSGGPTPTSQKVNF